MGSHHLHGSMNYIWFTNEPLGSGATGAVYKGRNKNTGEECAVKTFNMQSRYRPAAVQMREFDVLKKLDHPNVVRLLAVEDEKNTGIKVLVMELCTGGSLYSVLAEPQNSFGLPEEEFLTVLCDIAAGLEHLRSKGVVHRDIKPGNVLCFIAEDGGHVYKLTDFGAARELADDQAFMSLCGTEEYLHPDMYGRALLQIPHGKDEGFSAKVDLWSLGVTLYHVATGELPFRPYGGRENKQMMHRITTEKESGVISGVQETPNGPIKWSKALPESCAMSIGLKILLTTLLSSLMECNPDKLLTFEDFFNGTAALSKKVRVHMFNTFQGTSHIIYLDQTDTLHDLQQQLKEQSDISPERQLLLWDGEYLTNHITASTLATDYPKTSRDMPVFLFNIGDQKYRGLGSIMYENPSFPSELNPARDASICRECHSVLHAISREVNYAVFLQTKMHHAVHTLRTLTTHEHEALERRLSQCNEMQVDATKKLAHLIESHHITSQLCFLLEDQYSQVADSIQELNTIMGKHQPEITQVSGDMKDICDKMSGIFHSTGSVLFAAWERTFGCMNDKCGEKMGVLLDHAAVIDKRFQSQKPVRSLSYSDEQIHRFDREKLQQICKKAKNQLTSCCGNKQALYDKFASWMGELSKRRQSHTTINTMVNEFTEKYGHFSHLLDMCQQEYRQSTEALLRLLREQKQVNSIQSKSKRATMLKDINGGLMGLTKETTETKQLTQETTELIRKLGGLHTGPIDTVQDPMDASFVHIDKSDIV
ncbi:unnamed protein product [Owenia fusiformis]|uniref:IkappaB kinase n=1 Tax=Owenia fusiformis TaxID=6347 RepID=A0A8J1XYG1_OWEFU|nr:unnamed protein product [Owenia fusiformis]